MTTLTVVVASTEGISARAYTTSRDELIQTGEAIIAKGDICDHVDKTEAGLSYFLTTKTNDARLEHRRSNPSCNIISVSHSWVTL